MKVSAIASAFTLALGLAMQPASADSALKTLKIDPGHTYPSFEVDHGGGLSILRGKFNSTSGTITLDRESKTGTIDVTIDATSLDFGHDKFNEHVKSADMLDVAKHPTASYKGKLADFQNGAPTKAKGELTLRGVTKPVELTIDRFVCRAQPSGKEICGANATGKFDRADFGIDYGKNRGFFMDVTLAIGIEAKEE